MCGESFTFWSCVVLFITSSTKTSGNFTSDNKEDNIWEGNIWEETYNHTKFIGSRRNNNNETHILPYEKCANITCIQLCCPLGDRFTGKNCIASESEYVFPNVYFYSIDMPWFGDYLDKKVDELFPLTVRNPCQETIHFVLNPNDSFLYFSYEFSANSSLYLSYFDIFVESASYCLAIVDHNQFDAFICSEAVNETINKEINMEAKILKEIAIILPFLFLSSRIVSILCLLTTFVVYSLLPKLRNIHSSMLCKYCSLLLIEIILELLYLQLLLLNEEAVSYFTCVIIASINYFCHLSSSSWLSIMSFNMWWTFRDFRLLHRNKRAKQERKKLIYSIFVWGGCSIFTIIYIIMDFVPKSKYNTELKSCINTFWFDASFRWYFCVPQSVCIISSLCLSIYTALKIMRYEKDTARHLRDSESRFYNDNKQWFNLYLSLFIMLFIIMGINWIIITANEFKLFHDVVIYCIIFALSTMQDIGTFIIFVCKKTIMRQLLERFYQKCKCFSKIST